MISFYQYSMRTKKIVFHDSKQREIIDLINIDNLIQFHLTRVDSITYYICLILRTSHKSEQY